MTLLGVLLRGGLLQVTCVECGARTNLEARFFIGRYGQDATLEKLSRSLLCTGCGSNYVVVGCGETAEA